MEKRKFIGNWSLRIGDWTIRTQMEIGLGVVVFLYRVIQDSATVSAVKIKTVLVISNFFLNLYFKRQAPEGSGLVKLYWTRVSSSLTAALKVFSFFRLNHHSGAVFFIRVSIFRIPTRYQMPFNFPLNEDCRARRLMANPLSRYSM